MYKSPSKAILSENPALLLFGKNILLELQQFPSLVTTALYFTSFLCIAAAMLRITERDFSYKQILLENIFSLL